MATSAEMFISTLAGRPDVGLRPNSVVIACTFELREVARVLLLGIPGVVDVRIRPGPKPKLFVVTSGKDLDRDFAIAQRLVQVEDIKPNTLLHYDVVPEGRAHLIPPDAISAT